MTATKKIKLTTMGQEPITLFGLLSDEKDYKLSWHLNSLLSIHLKKAPDFKWTNNKLPLLQQFPCFTDVQQSGQFISLIRNLSHENIRISSFREFNYLFLIPADSSLNFNNIQETLRNSNIIRGVYKLDASAILEWLD